MRLSDRTTQHGRKKKHIFPDYSVCMLDTLTELKGGMGAEPLKKKNMPKLLTLHKEGNLVQ